MLLAGVVMKLGAYGCLRVALTLFPQGARQWAWLFGLLAVVGIVYGALVALVQKDFKFVIGYSSVSHMGFVLLGLMALYPIGISGAVLQMVSHGIVAGLLFAVVGRMVYDRAHTRDLSSLQGMRLSRQIPFAAVTFTLASVASMGLPGFSGFVAELQVLIGAWRAFPTLAVIAGLGILVGVAYTLRALQQAFFGDKSRSAQEAGRVAGATPGMAHAPSPGGERVDPHQAPNGTETVMDPITVPERIGALLLIGSSLFIGLYPNLFLQWIIPSLAGPLFENLGRVLP
jgi:NADH-quinone oxidoreductase subunit M